jgi:hypothetical protein
MPIKADEVRRGLESRLHADRTPSEAAGEYLWLADTQHSSGLISGQSRTEMRGIIEDWLRAQSEADEMRSLRRLHAESYAEFLNQKADLTAAVPPWVVLDAPLSEWRSTRGRA